MRYVIFERESEEREGRSERRGGCGSGPERQGCGGREQSFEARGWRRGGWGEGRFDRGFGGGRERLFDAGDLKLVILKLLSEQASYGYQLIKTMEERLSGGYTPSAGVIYPTLTLLEEEGLAVSTSENNKKVYSVTAEGTAFLEANRRRIEELFVRLEEAGKGFERGRRPEVMRAFMNLRGAVRSRLSREGVTAEQLKKIAEAIDAAAKAIDKM